MLLTAVLLLQIASATFQIAVVDLDAGSCVLFDGSGFLQMLRQREMLQEIEARIANPLEESDDLQKFKNDHDFYRGLVRNAIQYNLQPSLFAKLMQLNFSFMQCISRETSSDPQIFRMGKNNFVASENRLLEKFVVPKKSHEEFGGENGDELLLDNGHLMQFGFEPENEELVVQAAKTFLQKVSSRSPKHNFDLQSEEAKKLAWLSVFVSFLFPRHKEKEYKIQLGDSEQNLKTTEVADIICAHAHSKKHGKDGKFNTFGFFDRIGYQGCCFQMNSSFKFLADRLGFKCRFIRVPGFTSTIGHCFNVGIVENDLAVLVDTNNEFLCMLKSDGKYFLPTDESMLWLVHPATMLDHIEDISKIEFVRTRVTPEHIQTRFTEMKYPRIAVLPENQTREPSTQNFEETPLVRRREIPSQEIEN